MRLMGKFNDQFFFGLEDEIISQWQKETPKLVSSLTKYCHEKMAKELYLTCLRGLIKAVNNDDEAELARPLKMLKKTQKDLPPNQTYMLLELIMSFKNVAGPYVHRYAQELMPGLEQYSERLISLFVQYLSVQLAQQEASIRLKNKLLERRAWELSVLSSSSAFINSTLEVQQVLDSILAQVGKIMGTNTCAIYGLDAVEQRLKVIAHQGLNPRYTGNISIPVGQGVVGVAVNTRKPVVLCNVQEKWTKFSAPEFIIPVLDDINFGAVLATPLIHKEKVLGCVAVFHSRPYQFPQAQQSLLSIFADQAAMALENARLHKKAKELVIVEERNRIARDLHDSVSQSLFSVVLNAEACIRMLEGNNVGKALETMTKLQSIAQETSSEIKNLIFELRPTALNEKGLISALSSHIEVFSKRNGLPVNFSYQNVRRLPENLELSLYRVAQEAMTNVVKHASAQRIDVSLCFESSEVLLTVTDDGQGFDSKQSFESRKKMGLATMQERIESNGGEFLVSSAAGYGTTVEAHIPIKG